MYKALLQLFAQNYARNLLMFFGIMLLCGGVLGSLLLKSNEEIARSDNWVTHSYNIINNTRELTMLSEALLVDQYQYLMTRNDEHLARYDRRKTRFSELLALLAENMSDNPAQMSRLEQVRKKYGDLTTHLEERSASSSRKSESSESITLSASLKREIKLRAREIIDEETALLNGRLEKLQSTKDFYFITLVAGGSLSFLLLLVLNGFLLHAQSARSFAERSLEEVEERLKLALRGSSDGIFDWDLRSDDIYWSAEYKSMLGYREEELVAGRAIFNSLLHPEDQKLFWDSYNQYIAGKKKEFMAVFRMRHKSGRWIWINARGKALFDQNGHPTRFIGAHTDISHLKEYEIKLQETINKAEKANKAKSDFLAHMSHEIRTPLTAISGIAEIFERNKDNLNSKQKQLVTTLNASTFTLRELINDILDFSKIESGELELEEKSFSLADVFKQVKQIMSVKANEKGLAFTFEYRGLAQKKFMGDEKRLRQIMINLIGNAIKFTSQGEISVKVSTVKDRGGSDRILIDVKDTGIGISEDKQELVFERFKQGDASVSRKYGGSGLGLPISRSLARLMGGDITVDSVEGAGSTFSVLLPLSVVEEQEATSKASAGSADTLDKKIKSVITPDTMILVVEDYEGNIVMISYILDELGAQYDIARTGVEAVALWEKGEYKLVLMDIQMPEMDGFTATAQIREREKAHPGLHTPIVGMTAHALVGDRDKCIEAGMDAYLPKPIVEADLKEQIYKYLSR